MGLLDKLFGRGGGGAGMDVDQGVNELSALYDDPEVKSEGGISITGPRATEVRAIGKKLHQAGGKAHMEAARDGLRARHGWAGSNLENIWESTPEWRG